VSDWMGFYMEGLGLLMETRSTNLTIHDKHAVCLCHDSLFQVVNTCFSHQNFMKSTV